MSEVIKKQTIPIHFDSTRNYPLAHNAFIGIQKRRIISYDEYCQILDSDIFESKDQFDCHLRQEKFHFYEDERWVGVLEIVSWVKREVTYVVSSIWKWKEIESPIYPSKNEESIPQSKVKFVNFNWKRRVPPVSIEEVIGFFNARFNGKTLEGIHRWLLLEVFRRKKIVFQELDTLREHLNVSINELMSFFTEHQIIIKLNKQQRLAIAIVNMQGKQSRLATKEIIAIESSQDFSYRVSSDPEVQRWINEYLKERSALKGEELCRSEYYDFAAFFPVKLVQPEIIEVLDVAVLKWFIWDNEIEFLVRKWLDIQALRSLFFKNHIRIGEKTVQKSPRRLLREDDQDDDW